MKKIFFVLFSVPTLLFSVGKKEVDLFNAVMQDDLNKVNQLIAQKTDVKARTKKGETPLHYAEDIQIVEALIKAGADINATSKDGTTPLFAALFTKNRKKAALLLGAGANVNYSIKVSGQNYTPLRWVAEENDYSLVKLLLKKGAQIPSFLPLVLQEIGNVKITQLFDLFNDYKALQLKGRNQLNLKDNKGLTRMHQAVINNDLVNIDALLLAGANINVQDRQGNTPLDLAYKLNRTAIVKRLVTNNAQLNRYQGTLSLSNALHNLTRALESLYSGIEDILLYS